MSLIGLVSIKKQSVCAIIRNFKGDWLPLTRLDQKGVNCIQTQLHTSSEYWGGGDNMIIASKYDEMTHSLSSVIKLRICQSHAIQTSTHPTLFPERERTAAVMKLDSSCH